MDRKKEARVINMQIAETIILPRNAFNYGGAEYKMKDTTFMGNTKDSIRVSRKAYETNNYRLEK